MASMWPPKKNTAFTLCFSLYKNDGTIIANPGTYTRVVSVDGGAVDTTPVNSVTEEDTTYGQLSWVLDAAEMNGDWIYVQCKDDTTGCVPFSCTLYPVANTQDEIVDGTVKAKVDAVAISGDTTAADNCELMFDGTGYAGGTAKLTVDAVKVGGTTCTAEANIGQAALVANNLDHLCKTATAAADMTTEVADNTILSRFLGAGDTSTFVPSTMAMSTLADDTEVAAATVSALGTGAGLTTLATQASVNTVDDFLDTELAAITAAVITNAAGTDIAADIIAVKAETAAIFAGTVTNAAGADVAADIIAIKTVIDAFATTDDVADAVWDESIESTHQTAGTAGKKLDDAGAAGDPWNTAIPGAYGAGTAGLLLGTTIPAAITAIDDLVDTEVAAIKTKTDFLPSVTAGAAGGVFIAGANAATSITTALTANVIGNITGNLSGTVGSVTGAVGSVANIAPTGTGLTAIPWNAAWDAEVQSEAQDAITASALATAAELAKVPKSDATVTWNSTALASVQSSASAAITAAAIPAGTVTALGTGSGLTALATAANQTTIINRLGAFAGTGVNTVLGMFKALLSSAASTPSDVGGTFNPATDSTEAIRDRGDAAWGAGSVPTVGEIRTEMDSNSTRLAHLQADYTTTVANRIDAAISTRSSHSAADVATALGTGAGLTTLASAAELAKVPKSDGTSTWNATALAAVQSECTDALNDYDPPTKAELDAADDAVLAAIAALTESGIKKNTELVGFPFFMALTTNHVSGATGKTVTATRSLDGAAFGACANAVTEIANGFYKITLAAADLNGDMVALRFTATNCDDTAFFIRTSV